MNKTKWLTCLLLVIFSLLLVPQQQEKIREEVTVINVEVPVRVFYKGKTVAGLKKSDFKLLVGRKEVPIHGFNEYRKKIQLKELEKKEQPEIKPRLFLIILNVSDYNDEVAQNVDYLFNTIICKGDRLLVLSNNFFINDHLALDIKKEKDRVVRIAQLESKKIKKEIFHLENKLERVVDDFTKRALDGNEEELRGVAVEPWDMYSHTQNFVSDYLQVFSEFNNIFFDLKATQYLQMANYLSEQSCEKWGINIYQIGLFPELKRSGKLYRTIEEFRMKCEAGGGEGDPQTVAWMIDILMQKIYHNLHGAKFRGEEDIAKPFINTGVSLHTLLMKPMSRRTLQHFEYKPIKIESENVLRKISTMTGGQVIGSNKAEEFVEKIVDVEDVYYRLTFDPAVAGVDAKAKVTVKTNYPNYKLIYDNQQRPRYIEEVLEKVEKRTIPIVIDGLKIENRILSFDISNIQVSGQGEDTKGKVDVHIKVVDDQFNVIHDRKKVIEPTQNFENIKVGFSKLKPGKYDVIVEVVDKETGKNDLALKEIQVGKITIVSSDEALAEQFGLTNRQKEQTLDAKLDSLLRRIKEIPESKKLLPIETRDYSPQLIELVKKSSEYCSRLEGMAINFYCKESIDERIFNPFNRDSPFGSVDRDPNFRDKYTPKEGYVILKTNTIARLIKNNRYSYDYQLAQKDKAISENRKLIKENGRRASTSETNLKTRFKYQNIIFGPLIFGERMQEIYEYKLVGKKRSKGKVLRIIEATPLSGYEQELTSAKLWVDEIDFSIHKIEIIQNSIKNFEQVAALAKKNRLEPQIKITQEYGIEKNGIRFPSVTQVDETYLSPKKQILVISKTTIKYTDYKFFTVGTKVTEEKIKK